MAPKFQIKVFQLSRFVKNFTIISVVTLSFLLVFFSKTDYYLISGIKNLSSSVIIPISRFISAPVNVFSNFIDEYKDDLILKDTCMTVIKYTPFLEDSTKRMFLKYQSLINKIARTRNSSNTTEIY